MTDTTTTLNLIDIFNTAYISSNGNFINASGALNEASHEASKVLYDASKNNAYKPLPNEQLYEFVKGFNPLKPMTYDDVLDFADCLGWMFEAHYDPSDKAVENTENLKLIESVIDTAMKSDPTDDETVKILKEIRESKYNFENESVELFYDTYDNIASNAAFRSGKFLAGVHQSH
jgi:hypothetical protein